MRTESTADQILRAAQELVRSRGFHGFRCLDLAIELEVGIADVHKQFASKTELGCRLIDRIQDGFGRKTAEIDRIQETASSRLVAYASLFEWSVRADELCLFGVLAAEVETLPLVMQKGISRHFEQHRNWTTSVLRAGKADGSLHFRGSPEAHARTITASFLGALIVTKIQGSMGDFIAIRDLSINRYRSHEASGISMS
ncbi:MAG: TetR/AcrR family transcriptional regulator [Hyphomicrobiaceae bacterium]